MHRTTSFWPLSIAVLMSLWLGTQLAVPAVAQEPVRAQVGIEVLRSGENAAPAKARETLKAGDGLRVYVKPATAAYIYVVHNDGKKLTLLNEQSASTKTNGGMAVTLPDPKTFYTVDGGSDRESITVICSPTELREVASLSKTPNVAQKNWLSLEKELVDKGKIELSQPVQEQSQIAGNVRSMEPDAFLKNLPVFSGKSLVVKKYDFQVQK